MIRVRDLVAAIDRAAPFNSQLPWDNSGLLVGDPARPVARALVALDPTLANLREAARRRAQCLVTHHPIFWSKLKSLSPESHVGAVVLEAAAARVALIAAHTNYDLARGGLNDLLARRLGLEHLSPLEPPAPDKGYKLVTFVPAGDLERVQRALFAAGAGRIGDYSECSFCAGGTGTFLGGSTTHPTVGRRGRREETPELRLETVVPPDGLEAVVRALRQAHSYEEPAFDIYPLELLREGAGLGRAGNLARPEPLSAFIARVKRALGVGTVEVIGRLNRRVIRAAVIGGGAGDHWPAAAQAGADVFLTGEMKHHDRLAVREFAGATAATPAAVPAAFGCHPPVREGARSSRAGSLVAILAGHYATEYPAVAGLAGILRAALPNLKVLTSKGETNPTQWR